jgi:nicotinic acid mononucleotide adenylyltransferase
MAVSAYRRARHLSGRPDDPVIGASCTASLVSQRPKRGEHRAYIAVQTPTHTDLQSLKLQRAIRDRQTEGLLVGEHVLRCLARAVDLTDVPQIPLGTGDTSQWDRHTADPLLARLWHKRINHVWAWPDGRMQTDFQSPVSALLCGSFNPLHAAHMQLREVSQGLLGRTVRFELSITNADKAPLNYISIAERVTQFSNEPILLTNAATFAEKSAFLPGTVFVVGIDTVARIVQAKYYTDNPQGFLSNFEILRENQCRFLVAGRNTEGHFQTLDDITLPSETADLFQQIPAADFRMDLSSTALRAQQ